MKCIGALAAFLWFLAAHAGCTPALTITVITQLLEDDRIFGTVEALLGPGFLWNGSEGNLIFHSDAPWHTDRPKEPAARYILSGSAEGRNWMPSSHTWLTQDSAS